MSKALKIIGLVVLGVLLFMGSFKLLVRHIFNRQDCERFNLDNIELRTGINVPPISDCHCRVTDNTKLSTFKLDTSVVDIASYAEINGFEKSGELYEKSSETKNTSWHATLNDDSAELSFLITYK